MQLHDLALLYVGVGVACAVFSNGVRVLRLAGLLPLYPKLPRYEGVALEFTWALVSFFTWGLLWPICVYWNVRFRNEGVNASDRRE
jgi:uncharacterized membrane protein YjgN (DUF898 family)